ncbi:MAG: PqqD family protein [Thermodesulfovibrionales bacterium]
MEEVTEYFEQTFQVKGEIISRKIAGETLLVPIRGRLADMQLIFSLNPVADYIWKKLDGRNSLSEIRRLVVETFDVKEDKAASDIREFIEDLLKSDLIAGPC